VGGGAGSIACWLCKHVGVEGGVVVTDINTRFLDNLSLPNIKVRRHNIVADTMPKGVFDLVHAAPGFAPPPARESP
jgi:hypothetical protein